MGEVDIADELRLQYRPLLVHTKLEVVGLILMWGGSFACTNVYLMFSTIQIQAECAHKGWVQSTEQFLIDHAISSRDPDSL